MMEGLLHWDFAPGLALADQVRRRFGSTVHFFPSRDVKEFFLVASFSSASFPLTVESVGIALQCCTGGYRVGLNVVQISPRAFRFSVANNKVGHFIYSLKDRVWPDFVCHFHLFNGRFNQAPVAASCWHADEELPELIGRRPIAIQSKLVLTNHTSVSTSMQQLAKFNLVSLNFMRFSNKDSGEASTSNIGTDQ